MGSSVAIGLLARFSHFISDIPINQLSSKGKVHINDYKPNKLKCDDPVKIVDASNRSEKRFHKILKHVKNKSATARSSNTDLTETLNTYHSKLKEKYGTAYKLFINDQYENMNAIIPPSNKYQNEFIITRKGNYNSYYSYLGENQKFPKITIDSEF